jgi:hypothetical protein
MIKDLFLIEVDDSLCPLTTEELDDFKADFEERLKNKNVLIVPKIDGITYKF